MKVYYVDIDGVLCTDMGGHYEHAKPLRENIEKVNALYDDGNQVILWTARGTTTGRDWRQFTLTQLALWGVKFHRLELGKPYYDVLIDDKSRPVP